MGPARGTCGLSPPRRGLLLRVIVLALIILVSVEQHVYRCAFYVARTIRDQPRDMPDIRLWEGGRVEEKEKKRRREKRGQGGAKWRG